MNNILCALILFCTTSAPLYGQDILESQIQATDEAFAKYSSTGSVRDLRSALKQLVMIKLPNDKANEIYLPQVSGFWIEWFKLVDTAYDPTFDPSGKRPVLIDAPRSPNSPESPEELANRELSQKSTNYWSLKALDDTATAAVRIFARYHYRKQQEREDLRQIALQRGLSAKRIDRIFPLLSP